MEGSLIIQGLTLDQFINQVRAVVKEEMQSSNSHIQATEVISRDELCKRLSVTEPTVIRWEKKGRIPVLRIGSAVRYNWPAVVEALQKT